MKRRGQSDRLQTRGQPYIGDFAAGVNVFVGAAGTHSQSPAVVVGCAVGRWDGCGVSAQIEDSPGANTTLLEFWAPGGAR